MEVGAGDGEVRGLAIALALLLTAGASAETPSWPLTPGGWGPAHIGMTRVQVSSALHVQLEGDAFDNEGKCINLIASDDALPGLFFMFLDGRLSRITVTEPSQILTPRGIGIGATADEVRKTYGPEIKAEPHHYYGEPAEYLTYWIKSGKSGVRFETDTNRKVETIHAGNDSIQYVEGCA
jgi:hypothetical protein